MNRTEKLYSQGTLNALMLGEGMLLWPPRTASTTEASQLCHPRTHVPLSGGLQLLLYRGALIGEWYQRDECLQLHLATRGGEVAPLSQEVL